jgi:hypothetical protein
MSEDVMRRGVAEFVGAFTLIFIGGGAGIVSGQDRPADRRGDEPRARVRPRADWQLLGEGWIYWLGPALGALLAASVYEYLYLRPTRPPVVGTPESDVAEPRPGDTALD